MVNPEKGHRTLTTRKITCPENPPSLTKRIAASDKVSLQDLKAGRRTLADVLIAALSQDTRDALSLLSGGVDSENDGDQPEVQDCQ